MALDFKKEYKKVLKAIEKYDTIVVVRHEVPDFDASGSQFGLVTWIKDNYPTKKVYAMGQSHKFFAPKLYPLTDANVEIEEPFLCIAVDIADRPRLDGKEYIAKADYIIKIDHHPLCDDFGDLVIIDETAAAAAELIGEMLISFKKTLSTQCAYYLYSAIVGDSGRFQYAETNPRTFRVASYLFETGIPFQEIYDKMYLKSISDIGTINYIYSHYKLSEKNVAYYFFSVEDLKACNMAREQVKAYVNLFAGYEEVPVWVQFTEDENATDEYRWRVSIRSRGIKINDVATMFHGGGHDNAAGAKCTGMEEMEQLIKELDKIL